MQYEKSGVPFKPSAIKEWKNICNQKKGTEKHCIERAYDKLMGSVVTLKTAQGKRNKIQKKRTCRRTREKRVITIKLGELSFRELQGSTKSSV